MEAWTEKLMNKHLLAEKEVAALLQCGELRTYAPGSSVIRVGERNDCIFILKKGIWREYFDQDGEEVTVWFSVAGEITFSVWGYVLGQPARLNVESLTESEAVMIPRKRLEELYATSLAMANMGRRMIENFAVLYEGWHIGMWQKNAMERYESLLREYPEVIQSVPMKYVASYLGVTVQSLSRIRAAMVRK